MGQLEIGVYYEHERGDYPYETAQWIFDFSDPGSSLESLNFTEYDGGPARWNAAAHRVAGGPVQTSFEQY